MPTQKFLNLCIYKKQLIVNAMKQEILRVPYSEITVSRVAKTAGISRASFYTYFDGKEDLFSYMLCQVLDHMESLLILAFQEEDGCFGNSMKRVFHMFTRDDTGALLNRIRKQSAEDREVERIFTMAEMQIYSEERRRHRGKQCYQTIDPSAYPGLDEEYLTCAIDIGIMIIFKTLFQYCGNTSQGDELNKVAEIQLDILEKGIGD